MQQNFRIFTCNSLLAKLQMGNLTHDTLCKGVELQFSGPGLSMVEPLAMNSTERKKILTVLLSLLRCINWFHENRNQSGSNLAKDCISPRGEGEMQSVFAKEFTA